MQEMDSGSTVNNHISVLHQSGVKPNIYLLMKCQTQLSHGIPTVILENQKVTGD